MLRCARRGRLRAHVADCAVFAEIYSTGRANLPGSTVERDLQRSFVRMLGELFRFSSASHVRELLEPEHRELHREDEDAEHVDVSAIATTSADGVFSGWTDRGEALPAALSHSDDAESDLELGF